MNDGHSFLELELRGQMDLSEVCKSKVKAQMTSCRLVSAVQDLTLAGLLGPLRLSVSPSLLSPFPPFQEN